MQKKYQKILEYQFMYSAGSVIYAATEVAFRGHTHWTMVITGGICAMLLHLENKRLRKRKLYFRCLIGSATITALEFVVGCLVNRLLNWNVWSYSDRFLNIYGQICPLFSVFWFFLCIPAMYISTFVSDRFHDFFPCETASLIKEQEAEKGKII